MRKFNYINDHNIIGTTIKGYINQLSKEIELLKEMENNPIYEKAYDIIEKFKNKYPDLNVVSSLILEDLLSKENVEYCFKNGKYPPNASQVGVEFESELEKIFLLESELRELAIEAWKNRLTKFEDINNGEDFMFVGHASCKLPGVLDDYNYNDSDFRSQYLSCSLFSNNELNAFSKNKLLFVAEVNENNYIAASSYDSVTADFPNPSFETLKEISCGKKSHFIKVGYTNESNRAVTMISTPELIERLSVEREINENGELFVYDKSLTNEIVLDRTTTKLTGVVLLSNGCDFLLNEYLFLKQNNLNFKCINKGLYREKRGLASYTESEFQEFMNALYAFEKNALGSKIPYSILVEYYNDVVIPMNYPSEILEYINNVFSKYIDIPEPFKV